MTKALLTFASLLIFFMLSTVRCMALGTDDGEEISFGCRGDKAGLGIYIKNYVETSKYSVSFDGGKNFIPISPRSGILFTTLPDGTYQVCVMKDGDRSTVTDIKVCELRREDTEEYPIRIQCEGLREDTYNNGGIRVTIENYSPASRYMLSYDGGRVWHKTDGRVTEVRELMSGYYNVCVKSPDNIEITSADIEVYVPPKAPEGRIFIRAPLIKQLPELPTGCEITSLAMALGYYGFNINHTVLSDYYLEKTEYQTGDFRKKFVGDPRTTNSYGCYADVIVNSAERFLGSLDHRTFDVVNLTGCKPERLYAYLDMEYPVIVWATTKMMPSEEGARWMDHETGNIVTWKTNEHCLLLTGYDLKQGRVYMNDPQYGVVSYDMKLFEERFREMESQAIVIVETTKYNSKSKNNA